MIARFISPNPCSQATIYGQKNTCNVICLIGREEYGSGGDVPSVSHFPSEWHSCVPFPTDGFSVHTPLSNQCSIAIGVSIKPGKIAFTRTPYSAFSMARFCVIALIPALAILSAPMGLASSFLTITFDILSPSLDIILSGGSTWAPTLFYRGTVTGQGGSVQNTLVISAVPGASPVQAAAVVIR